MLTLLQPQKPVIRINCFSSRFNVVPVFLFHWSRLCRFPFTLLVIFRREPKCELRVTLNNMTKLHYDFPSSRAEHINHYLNFLSLPTSIPWHNNNQKKGFQIKLTSTACRIFLIEQPPANKNISLLHVLVVNINIMYYYVLCNIMYYACNIM